MGENNNQDEAVEQILSAALTLFMEKGYDNTSVQDIADKACISEEKIYRHYQAKEDIMQAILIGEAGGNSNDELNGFINQGGSGRDILKNLFIFSLTDESKLKLDAGTVSVHQNARLLVSKLKLTLFEGSQSLEQILIRCNEDGSLKIKNPKHTAEIIGLLLNFWLNPGVFDGTWEELMSRVDFYKSMMLDMGIDIIDDEVHDAFIHYYRQVFKKEENRLS